MTTEGKSMFHSRVHIEAGDLVILFMVSPPSPAAVFVLS